MSSTLNVVVLAAGQGKRMYSSLPKVLHPIAGKPLLGHVLDTARQLGAGKLVVVHGHGGEQVQAAFAGQPDLAWAHQAQQLGTGHALAQAMPHVGGDVTLMLYGDVPLTRLATLQQLLDASAGGKLGILTDILDDATGYGRIVRDAAGAVQAIVEQKDCTPEQAAIREMNTGILALPTARLAGWLGELKNDNAQGEYYATDLIALAVRDGVPVATVHPKDHWEAEGINNKLQLAVLERIHQREQANALLAAGVGLLDPARFDLRGTLSHGKDVVIDVNCVFEGKVALGNNVQIGANCVLKDVTIADGVVIHPFCHLEDAQVGPGALIGPYARLRPGAELAADVHIGNFVEVKKSTIGTGSKVNHLTYIGDTTMGSGVNVGAGTITANYDGVNKFRTVIEDGVRIGSNNVLVAPVTIGTEATTGAGSVISKDAPAGKLTLARAKQVTLDGWQRPVKKKD
ncbi:bifunctional UDP-N-acetylglucosamine pyrophosphorylase / Glucosamine-1-phosphate N-acetyltransferase [Andreprevotia lacus DSM 23236]|jgi:bifunctional UDP-N-acetylglucosamine pyrophosphorylase/glucosamine-1-phosphate N-acetyltransferase|uniref:Bifunctional protein GlmU n=1 Tax=Andreprevotia lacus DSM 23236 TaxID=1121001 RepID=A0A1W1XBF3_9NEIS|nr:bifunctional UDP-N-acetylglucosamine diphosphorylase/glucosamine-1-phosphate N-acetyltransferase GlmU [Andreprevotia lacus]SMC21266.1 bifunctional UDP-N-acetylglucosamine pyrophosphorylase / Glucosamine-1-phosphate N-acetyltransferase [Andreprevotia lacus DSM 23236]